MLAKLKVLRQEDKALQEIETKLRAQLNRLKQEERVLRRQMRKTHGEGLTENDEQGRTDVDKDLEAEPDVDNDKIMNQAPLMDLNEAAISILQAQMGQNQYVHESNMEEEVEEEEDEEEEEEEQMEYRGISDEKKPCDDEEEEKEEEDDFHDELTAEYQKLFMKMRAEVEYEEDFEDDGS